MKPEVVASPLDSTTHIEPMDESQSASWNEFQLFKGVQLRKPDIFLDLRSVSPKISTDRGIIIDDNNEHSLNRNVSPIVAPPQT
jgi:hypothetical protein